MEELAFLREAVQQLERQRNNAQNEAVNALARAAMLEREVAKLQAALAEVKDA